MENKVLVSLCVPSLETKYDIYVPVNRKIYSVIKMIKKSLFEISQGSFNIDKDYMIYNALSGSMYDINSIVRDTDIRNGSMIILL